MTIGFTSRRRKTRPKYCKKYSSVSVPKITYLIYQKKIQYQLFDKNLQEYDNLY